MSEARKLRRGFRDFRSDGSKPNGKQPQFITQYMLVQHPDLQGFVDLVQACLNRGWQCVGGVAQTWKQLAEPQPQESTTSPAPAPGEQDSTVPMGAVLHYAHSLLRIVTLEQLQIEREAAKAARAPGRDKAPSDDQSPEVPAVPEPQPEAAEG